LTHNPLFSNYFLNRELLCVCVYNRGCVHENVSVSSIDVTHRNVDDALSEYYLNKVKVSSFLGCDAV